MSESTIPGSATIPAGAGQESTGQAGGAGQAGAGPAAGPLQAGAGQAAGAVPAAGAVEAAPLSDLDIAQRALRLVGIHRR